ncbi:Aste57867_2276 [Aphanomyces stellatus]|uniref:Aste57867_2276 protein n=1 Tax=Aphanomyces stellatus TaxID=120398 RepID=A0A485KAY7_9STRA|nr:hypothetical protein As57867_002271 [Aphanomyces stellatus]VFT79479.1 Aste57867_2276 [Aphanomyces stellatus]
MTRAASHRSGHPLARLSSSQDDYGTPIMDHTSYTPETHEPTCLSPHALSDTDLCGWLWMRSSVLGRWRHRYFSFAHGLLSYFESFPSEHFMKQTPLPPPMAHLLGTSTGSGSQPRGVLRVAHIEEHNNKLGFKVYATSGKVIEIRAPRSDIRQTWLAALRATAATKSRSWSAHAHHDGPSSSSNPMMMRSTDPLSSAGNLAHGGRESIPVDLSGWLLKRSDILRRWNRYYFVLQDRMLSYYATDKPYDVPRRRGYIQAVCRDPKKPDTLVVTLSVGGDLRLRLPKGVAADVLADWFDCLVTTSLLYHSGDHCTGSLRRAARPVSDGATSERHPSSNLDRSFI